MNKHVYKRNTMNQNQLRLINIIQNDGNTVVKIVRDVMNFMYLEEQKIGVKTVNGYSI